jgi:asparagine synthetase B (glutamine-hydrolysing)
MCGIWGILSLDKLSNNNYFEYFNKIKYRGPDRSVFITNPNYIVGFHRLAIMDTSINGDQPFTYSYKYKTNSGDNMLRTIYVIINGEIYNWKKLKESQENIDFFNKIKYSFMSNSDCEIVLPMFLKHITHDFYSKNNFDVNHNFSINAFKPYDISSNNLVGYVYTIDMSSNDLSAIDFNLFLTIKYKNTELNIYDKYSYGLQNNF